MRKVYREKACVMVGAEDATYMAEFEEEYDQGKAWEFDRMNDTSMKWTIKTGKIRVKFSPVRNSMAFPEDLKRKMEYIMPVEKARELYRIIKSNVNLWFALDMADIRCK